MVAVRGSGTILSLAAIAAATLFLNGDAQAAGPAATPTPRVLVRNPVDVPPARRADVIQAVTAAMREAGAATITAADFARVVEGRADVKVVLTGARDKAKTGVELDKGGEVADAVRSLEGAVEDFEFIGADVWLPEEVGKAYLFLGTARWHRDQAQKAREPSKPTVSAWRRGRELIPDFVPGAPEFSPADIAIIKKTAGGVPGPPGAPGEGLFSLGRLLGLDGVVEVRGSKNGALALRVHKIEPTTVKTFKVASRGRMLDEGARKQLRAGFGFPGGPLPPLVAAASATPPPAAATPTPVTATPTPTMVAVAPTPTPKPSPTVAVAPTPEATPSAAVATPPPATPTPTAVAVATPPRNGNGNGNGSGRPKGTPRPEPTATPVLLDSSIAAAATPAPGRPSMFAGSYASVSGGADHRAVLYTTKNSFTSAPSGTSPAGWVQIWYVWRDVWALSAGGGGMERVYQIDDEGKMASATSRELWVHAMRSDDARGRWWIGGGVYHVYEPRVTAPGGYPESPEVARLTPVAVGIAQFPLGDRFLLRGRAAGGIAIEDGKSVTTEDRPGVGYDLRVQGEAVFALTRRIRLNAGVAGQRVVTDFGKQIQGVEARRGFWLGVEAGF